MSFCSSILCPDCGFIYNDSTRRPCIGKCNHTICLTCKNALNSSNCPICDAADAFEEITYNHGTVNFLADFHGSLSEADIDKALEELENLGHGPCAKCNIETSKLRVCTACTNLVIPGIQGSWDLITEENVGESVFLKVKSLAICSNCAIDHHEGHKIVLLNSISDLKNHAETKTINALGALIESNWEREIENRGYSKCVFMFKSIGLRWKIGEFLKELEKDQMEFSAHITTGNPVWAAQLANSVAEVRKHRKNLDDIEKVVMMENTDQLKKIIENLSSFEEHTEENRRYALQLREIYESFPEDLLSRTQPEYHQTIFKAELDADLLANAMADRIPRNRQFDWNFCRCEMIKEQMRICFDEVKRRRVEYNEAVKNAAESFVQNTLFSDNWLKDPNKITIEETEVPNEVLIRVKNSRKFFEAHQRMVDQRMITDKATVNWLKAVWRERFVDLMSSKCFPVLTDDPEVYGYILELEALKQEMGDVVMDLKQ